MKTIDLISIKRPVRTLALAGMVAGMLLGSCTDRFEEYNTDPNGLTDEALVADFQNVGGFFPQMQQSVYYNLGNSTWEFQVYQNLNADVYSGYMMSPNPFNGNNNNFTYALVPGWNGYAFDYPYTNVLAPFLQVKERAEEEAPHFYALGLIHKVEALHRVTDIYGPIPYSQAGQGGASIAYDSQQQVYEKMFEELEVAANLLQQYVEQFPASQTFAPFDRIYGGDYQQWIKFANSLRLRLAMRISKVDPVRAQEEAEAALNHPGGVLETKGDIADVASNSLQHPLHVISTSWADIRMGAEMESILGGYADPRLEVFFEPASLEGHEGEYKGIRSGIVIEEKADYVPFSAISTDYIGLQSPITLMTAAEVWFLRAEGAMRGWNMGGSAQQMYERGIYESFDQLGASGYDAYIADDASTAIPYEDPLNPLNNVAAGSPYLSTITIKWEEGATEEEKLERIITQKWIAMFPEGQEAWSEFRRTGYPVQFPVVENRSGGTITTEGFIKRLPYPQSEYTSNAAAVEQAVQQYLNGADNGGTRLWWDVD